MNIEYRKQRKILNTKNGKILNNKDEKYWTLEAEQHKHNTNTKNWKRIEILYIEDEKIENYEHWTLETEQNKDHEYWRLKTKKNTEHYE
jgi:hypothetical protein